VKAVVVTGARGLIGSRLRRRLHALGVEERLVSRTPPAASRTGESWVSWEDLPRAVEGAGALVNLAGEPIFGRRWKPMQKEKIRASRVDATQACVAALASAERPPEVFCNASAVGFYGPRGDEELDEETPPGSDFLAGVCRDWETAAAGAEAAGVRTVLLRTGIVLASEGGALARMLPPFRFFAGGWLGGGGQWMPWIHVEDLVSLILALLENPAFRGPVNACAPNPVRNRIFSRQLARTLRRPCLLPVPAPLLRLAFGPAAEVLLTGQRAVPRRALDLGFAFRFSALAAALENLLGPSRAGEVSPVAGDAGSGGSSKKED